MKRIDLNHADAALVAQCVQLAGADSVRQKMAVDLLVNAKRWPAVLNCLKAIAKQHGREAAQQLVLPPGDEALIHIASRDKAAPVATLDALRALAWVNSDAQALALARKPEPWESEFAPITPPSRQQWLNEGLRDAVLGDALDKLHWWQAQGADVRAQDDDGNNAVQSARSRPMLEWLLAQGAPTDGKRRWDGQAIDTMARLGQAELLRCMADHGADLTPLTWSALHHLVILGSAAELSAALADPQQAELLTQLEALDRWQRTPITHAAQQGNVAKLQALQQAGADVQVSWREHPLGYWVLQSGRPEAMQWWLAQSGVQVDAPMGQLQDSLLLEAVEHNNLPMAELLLAQGANPNRFNDNASCPMNSATSRAMQALLMAHGGDAQHMGREGSRVWLGLPGSDTRERDWLLACTPAEFGAQRTPRPGQTNGEDISTAFHLAMIESGESAYGAAKAFGLKRSFGDATWQHVWNVDRFGQSLSLLPDGRCIQIGGEHEDGYDPDFFIYNDVIVHTPPEPGSADPRWDRRVFAYPSDVFAPTDFHSATLLGDEIVVIGNLGYPEQRKPGHTPVYALHIHSLQMRELVCSGDMPGWIHRHQARAVDAHCIEVWGGQQMAGTGEDMQEMPGHWRLDLRTLVWSRSV